MANEGVQGLALIVEDHPALRKTIAAALADEGYSSMETDSVIGALKILETFSVAVIVLDLGLARRGGEELLSDMVERGLDVPVVLLSASPTTGSVARGFGLLWMVKPFELDSLLATVSTAIARKLGPKRVY